DTLDGQPAQGRRRTFLEGGYAGLRAAGCESRVRAGGWRIAGTTASGVLDCAEGAEAACAPRESRQHDCVPDESLAVNFAAHLLTSFTLARGFFPRRTWWFVVGVALAGTLADLDLLSELFGSGAYLSWR